MHNIIKRERERERERKKIRKEKLRKKRERKGKNALHGFEATSKGAREKLLRQQSLPDVWPFLSFSLVLPKGSLCKAYIS